MTVASFFWVAAGGAAGSVLRYAASAGIRGGLPAAHHHWATWAVNAAGCLAIGWLHTVYTDRPAAWPGHFFWITGLLGGFTTFSAFGWETFALLRAGRTGAALLYALGSLAIGVLAVAAGWRIGMAR